MAGDTWVQNSQAWINSTYAAVAGIPTLVEDGYSGWKTIFALRRALQHELGITALSDNFGATTLAQLTSQIGSITSLTTNSNIIAILQCGMWCKGYWGGTTLGTWDSSMAVPSMKADMGLPGSAAVPPKAMKSLLTMDAYVLVGGGTAEVRTVQQWLNSRYISRQDYFLVPCDGLFSRDVQIGLVYAIQYEIGMADGVANGNFGPGTQQGIRDYGIVSQGSSDGTKKFVSLFQAALILNGYLMTRDGAFGPTTYSKTVSFQGFAELPVNGSANFRTWASLLVSTGDPSRPGTAADASTPLTSATANQVYASGYRTIGRYLTVSQKRYQPGELSRIFSAGLSTFPIYQNAANQPHHFSEAIGYSEGLLAARRARQLGFKQGAIIYFAVDYDATGDDINALILPHFKGLKRGVETSTSVPYQVGIYGTRNVCAKVSAAGYAVSSFVAGMSTGYSGNLGYPLPSNWAYDQIQNLVIGSGTSMIEIDKNVRSFRATPVGASGIAATPIKGGPSFDEDFFWRLEEMQHQADIAALGASTIPVGARNEILLQNVQQPVYWDWQWQLYTPYVFMSDEFPLVQANYRNSPGTYPNTASYSGDFPHLAASIRGYTCHPFPHRMQSSEFGDLGGWALDLATSWEQYATQRRANGIPIGGSWWFEQHVGIDDVVAAAVDRFRRSDLISDVDAYLVAWMLNGTGRTFSDAMREVLVSCETNPTWRFAQFYALRFGGIRQNVVESVKHLFQSLSPLTSWPVREKAGDRLPGEDEVMPGDPTSAAEREDEINYIAEGFANVLVDFSTGARV